MLCKNSEFSRITEREKQSAAKLHRRRLFGGVDDVIAAGTAEVTGYYNLQGVRAVMIQATLAITIEKKYPKAGVLLRFFIGQ